MAQIKITTQDFDARTNKRESLDDDDNNVSRDNTTQSISLPDNTDTIFKKIQESVSKNGFGKRNSTLSLLSSTTSEEETLQISDNYTSIPYGIQPRATYDHGKKNTNIMGVAYNGRMRQFIFLDAKGITTWKRDAVEHRVSRAYHFDKYEYRMFTHIVYVRKFNCYFVLTKDFALKVLNRDFEETCTVSADMRSILFMLYNPLKDELITGGVGGTKFWTFHQVSENAFEDLKPMANCRLTLKYELPDVGGSWVKRVELDQQLEHLYLCSETNLYVYNLQGRLLIRYKKAHKMTITGVVYSMTAKVLITSSVDCDVKVWSMRGGVVHTFRGHSRAVTGLLIHPDNSSIIITSSLDGTIRMWSLQTMEPIYNLVVSSEGIMWMGLTDDNKLYICTCKHLSMWYLNYFFDFWSTARSKLTSMCLVGCPKKTTRVVTIGEDNSVRLFGRKTQKNLSTVLPPPDLSPLEQISSMCYSREYNVTFLLIIREQPKTNEVWVYTTRTDPSCRIAVWDVMELQIPYLIRRRKTDQAEAAISTSVYNNKEGPVYRATEYGSGTDTLTTCCCVCMLNSMVVMMSDEGEACPIKQTYLLLGMEDGRIFFMDPVIKGQKYMEFKASKDNISDMSYNQENNCLITTTKLKYLTQIQFWSLPSLHLRHIVYCALDIVQYTIMNDSFLTGHQSGCINLYLLEHVVDEGFVKIQYVPEVDDVVDIHKRPEHMEPIICVDSSSTMRIFLSTSVEGAIKIWTHEKLLLTEIMMDESLTYACFLNNKADLIMGFKNHIFYIDHTKVCPHLKPPEDSDEDQWDTESLIYEDPAVTYEGIVANPDPIDLDNYLVPYEIEFSKDFLEGKPLWDSSTEEEMSESDLESLYSMAPTEVYFSPPPTPAKLAAIDLTLRSEVTKDDLRGYMKSTMEQLLERAMQVKEVDKRGNDPKFLQLMRLSKLLRFQQALERNVKRKRKKKKEEEGGEKGEGDTDMDEEASRWRFNYPRVGHSPGPSPTLSTPSTNLSGESDGSDVSYEEVFDKHGRIKKKKKPKKKGFQPIEIVESSSDTVRVAKPKARYRGAYAGGESSGIGDVHLDVKTLMKKAAEAQRKEADHSHVKAEVDEHVSNVVRKYRDVQKKKVSKRRRPKPGQKLTNKPLAVQKPIKPEIKDAMLEKDEPKVEDEDEITTLLNISRDLGDQDDHKFDEIISQMSLPHVDPMAVPDLPEIPGAPEKEPLVHMPKTPPKKTMIDFFELKKPGLGGSPTTEVEEEGGEKGEEMKKKTSSVYSDGDDVVSRVMLAGSFSDEEDDEFDERSKFKVNVYGSPDSGWFESTPGGRGDGEERGRLRVGTDDDDVFDREKKRPLSSFVEKRLYKGKKDRPISATEIRQHCEEEALHKAFNEAYYRYQRLSRTPVTPNTLHQNNDLDFNENWHERSIERHMLLRMQKELRAHHAAQFRKKMEEEQNQKRKYILGLYDYDEDCMTTTDYQYQTCMSHDTRQPRPPQTHDTRQSHPPQSHDTGQPRPPLSHARQKMRGKVAETPHPPQTTPVHSRPHTAGPEYPKAAIPHLNSKHEQSHFNTDNVRPKTARLFREKREVTSRGEYEVPSRQGTYVYERSNQGSELLIPRSVTRTSEATTDTIRKYHSEYKIPAQTSNTDMKNKVNGKQRPQTAIQGQNQQKLVSKHEPGIQRTAIRLDEATEKTLKALARYDERYMADSYVTEEQRIPYRLNQSKSPQNAQLTSRSRTGMDAKWIDPRNPQALRPKSSKSIPSKCSRYVLLSKPKEKLLYPLPTPLEEQLLAERFPELGHRVYEHYDGLIIRHKKPSYNMDYTPYAHELYG